MPKAPIEPTTAAPAVATLDGEVVELLPVADALEPEAELEAEALMVVAVATIEMTADETVVALEAGAVEVELPAARTEEQKAWAAGRTDSVGQRVSNPI